MSYISRPYGLFFLLLVLLLGLQLSLKKPLCIESNIVYKIDKIRGEKTETIYSCNQFKKVPFSTFFYENLNILQTRLTRLELIMNGLALTAKSEIVIDTEDLDSIHFEKIVLKKSLKAKLGTEDEIFLETISDFLLGDKSYQNLISEAWGSTYADQGFTEKIKISKRIFRQLALSGRFDGTDSIEALKKLISSAENNDFEILFGKKLKDLGFYNQNELAVLELDYIIESIEYGKAYEILAQLAKANRNIKVAIKNSDGLYLLPSYLKMPETHQSSIHTRYRLKFDTQSNENTEMLARYLNNTESLILINSQSSFENLDLVPLFTGDIGKFLSRNKQIDFIQFHLPSYQLIYKDLSRVVNYFDFVQNKNLSGKVHKALGWSRTEWLKDLRVFRPVANYDFIQYFRIN